MYYLLSPPARSSFRYRRIKFDEISQFANTFNVRSRPSRARLEGKKCVFTVQLPFREKFLISSCQITKAAHNDTLISISQKIYSTLVYRLNPKGSQNRPYSESSVTKNHAHIVTKRHTLNSLLRIFFKLIFLHDRQIEICYSYLV